MAATVPTFPWTYKAGQQQQQPLPLCPQVRSCNCTQGHLDARYTLHCSQGLEKHTDYFKFFLRSPPAQSVGQGGDAEETQGCTSGHILQLEEPHDTECSV
ncbi:hypothetical protein NQZ68_008029 [Dissostichus eleginoides]|nr:hypothetical protein NQZ68_008029 [Dissostichus eleginoides]